MKRILLLLCLVCGLIARSQTYNNEWIDYSKTYYKFYVGRDSIHRIPQSTLAAAGLGATPAEHFQLWRNGVQVPIYTSVAAGPLGAGDYIEFWGKRNDGTTDTEMYLNADFQLNKKYSIQTDTASYFLTVNTAGGNLRLINTPNNVAGNLLPPDPYFTYTMGRYLADWINLGKYINAGEYVYSSSYDIGEGYTSYNIAPSQSLDGSHQLFLYGSGPPAIFTMQMAGNGYYPRRFKVTLNNDSIFGKQVDYLNYSRDTVQNIPLSLLSSGTANIKITNHSPDPNDRMVVAQYELIYPRVFNFSGAKNFEFELEANLAGNYLTISNFNHNSVPPVLYDLTNLKRYVADISDPALVKIVLEPSATKRKLVLVSQHSSNYATIGSITSRNFINYSNTANQGDYLIISHPYLYNGPGGSNPVEGYRSYRSSVAGGGYNAKIYEIDELVDQFAFGIKKHPASIRNFLRWARSNFSSPPKFVFLIGHGITYSHFRYYESNPDVNRLNLVPTFGNPASDVLLSAEKSQQIPLTPIGRLSAIDGGEVAIYLTKIQQYETAQKFSSPLLADKAWMKNVLHVVGGSDPVFGAQILAYMNRYKAIISDTLFGANVTTFAKSSPDLVEQIADQQITNLLNNGISQLVYFGHSSSTVLDFNLDNPEQYNNQGKYPIFIVMGCMAGNFFNFNPARFYVKETLSERFTFAEERGSIAYIASSHFGIAHYLDIYNTKTYKAETYTHYGKSIGEILKESVVQVFNQTVPSDFFARFTTEQTTLQGDPALKPNTHTKPDYVIEDPLVRINPSFISIAETSFNVDAKYINMGKAVDSNITVEIKRQYPNGTIEIVLKDTIRGIRYIDSININLPIDPTRDKGLNRITVTIDADENVSELYETNNSITKDVFIFEDDARPIYPLNYAIINKQNIKYIASTANPFSPNKQYKMELDTTELYNSPLKVSQTISSVGGVLEFNPTVTFTDSTVYYWRVSPLDSVGNAAKWNHASFIYLPNSALGFNQSHFYQHTKSNSERVYIDTPTRTWKYHPVINNLFVRTGIYPTSSPMQADYTIAINGDVLIGPGCNYNELIINVIDPVSFKPWANTTGTLYGSSGLCGTQREYNFHFFLHDTLWRRRAQNFLDNVVPDGYFVAIRSNTSPNDAQNTYAAAWRADTTYFGSGNSLYHSLKNQGFVDLDLYDTTRCFAIVYKKNRQASFTPKYEFTSNIYELLLMSVDCPTPDTLGYTTSPVFGPAREWKQFFWRGSSQDNTPGDAPTIDIIGIAPNGTETEVFSNLDVTQMDLDISSIDPVQYPYLKLKLRNVDSIHLTPYQLRYWRLTYLPVPEGAVAPNLVFQMKDTVEVGEPLEFRMAFKNVSEANFDSILVKMVVTDQNNVTSLVPVPKLEALVAGDTTIVRGSINTMNLTGNNTLFVDVNPDNDQPEQFHFNNFIYRKFFAKSDKINPVLDVTFDGVHILNRDIVSSKPHILIKLKDESQWMILNDTTGTTVQVRFPDGTLKPFHFVGNDTLKFTPAGNAPNPDNTATIDFTPYFLQDGDYELVVTGKDRSGNTAGNVEFKVGFQVINKPMISNMLNYPNPFTTSTAFVFTITGSEVPQNIKIQILTITGKIVREITKDELGPLHIGRNITEFKWDGTDQYGQKLGNGIYLYRVVTNLNGKSLDKYRHEDDNTDKYFNKGYGKMYLMR